MDFLNKMLGKVGVGGDPFSLSLLKRKQPTIPATDQTSQIIPQTSQSPSVNLNSPVKPEVKLPVAPAVSPTPMGSNVTQTPAIPVTNDQNAYKSANVVGGISSLTPPVPKIDTQDAQGAKESPAVPQVSPETQKALSSAEKAYEESLKVTPEELATQEDLDRLNESTKKAYTDISGQPIALEFITGQMRSMENRALGLAEPLERKLARLQSARTSAMESSKFALERNQKKLDAEKASAVQKPAEKLGTQVVEVGNRKLLVNTQTGETIKDLGISGGEKPMSQAQETAAIAKTEKETAAQQSATQSIGLVNSLLTGDRYKSISGALQTGSIPFFGDRAAVNEYDQLQGLLKLGIRGLLKGQGQISDYEGKILGQAASSLSRLTSESQTQEALRKIRGVLKTNQGLDTEVIVKDKNGQVVGRGMLNGKDIYDAVNDGNTVEYL